MEQLLAPMVGPLYTSPSLVLYMHKLRAKPSAVSGVRPFQAYHDNAAAYNNSPLENRRA